VSCSFVLTCSHKNEFFVLFIHYLVI
jgi:hypothetical protein